MEVGKLTTGQKQLLEIARALATDPKLLLLDEPAAGMNPQETADLMNIVRHIRDKYDVTILLIEHDMKFVSGLCDEVTVLNFGTVLAHAAMNAAGRKSFCGTNAAVDEIHIDTPYRISQMILWGIRGKVRCPLQARE